MLSDKRVILVAWIVGALVPWCLAQDVPKEPEKSEEPQESVFGGPQFEESEILVVELAHTWCSQVRTGLSQLKLPLRASCAGDTRVILQAPAEVLKHVREEVIPKIDVPDTMRASGEVAYIPLGHHPTEALLDLLHTAAPSKRARIAVDETNRLLVVHATDEEITAIRKVIQHVDRPAHSLTAYFFFIRAEVGVDFDPEYADLPEILLPVAKVLRENAFGVPTLLGSVILTVNEGQRFEQETVLQDTDTEWVGDQLRFLVRGMGRLNVEEELVQLQVEALVQGKYRTEEEIGGETKFDVSTTVAAKLGDFVVLGAGPATTAKGNAIAVAVRVVQN